MKTIIWIIENYPTHPANNSARWEGNYAYNKLCMSLHGSELGAILSENIGIPLFSERGYVEKDGATPQYIHSWDSLIGDINLHEIAILDQSSLTPAVLELVSTFDRKILVFTNSIDNIQTYKRLKEITAQSNPKTYYPPRAVLQAECINKLNVDHVFCQWNECIESLVTKINEIIIPE